MFAPTPSARVTATVALNAGDKGASLTIPVRSSYALNRATIKIKWAGGTEKAGKVIVVAGKDSKAVAPSTQPEGEKASPAAKEQITAYRDGRDGLADNGRDRWWRPKQIGPFNYGRRDAVSWRRLNKIATHPKGVAYLPSGARQVEMVARSLRGFNMDLHGHRAGRMDGPLLDAIKRFRKLRKVGETDVHGHLTPRVCYELCIPTVEED